MTYSEKLKDPRWQNLWMSMNAIAFMKQNDPEAFKKVTDLLVDHAFQKNHKELFTKFIST